MSYFISKYRGVIQILILKINCLLEIFFINKINFIFFQCIQIADTLCFYKTFCL